MLFGFIRPVLLVGTLLFVTVYLYSTSGLAQSGPSPLPATEAIGDGIVEYIHKQGS